MKEVDDAHARRIGALEDWVQTYKQGTEARSDELVDAIRKRLTQNLAKQTGKLTKERQRQQRKLLKARAKMLKPTGDPLASFSLKRDIISQFADQASAMHAPRDRDGPVGKRRTDESIEAASRAHRPDLDAFGKRAVPAPAGFAAVPANREEMERDSRNTTGRASLDKELSIVADAMGLTEKIKAMLEGGDAPPGAGGGGGAPSPSRAELLKQSFADEMARRKVPQRPPTPRCPEPDAAWQSDGARATRLLQRLLRGRRVQNEHFAARGAARHLIRELRDADIEDDGRAALAEAQKRRARAKALTLLAIVGVCGHPVYEACREGGEGWVLEDLEAGAEAEGEAGGEAAAE